MSSCNTYSAAKCISSKTINPNLKDFRNAFDGPISRKASEIEQEMQQGIEKPFRNVIRLNIGDAQSLGQSPITLLRQVMTLVSHPVLMNDKAFPEDAKLRAEEFLEDCSGKAIGSYPAVSGIVRVRKQIAKFIEEVDHVESNWENCYIGQGSGDMIRNFLTIINLKEYGLKTGVLSPVPECPFYSNIMAELGLHKIDYYIDEDNDCKISIGELQRAIDDHKTLSKPRAIIVINPGNPTSHILTKKNMEDIAEFAFRNHLIIISDEVYRTTILKGDRTFIPFRKVLKDMGKPYCDMELVTLMSLSDGMYAENGIRCGYAEIKNVHPEIPDMIYRLLSISPPACSASQAALYCVVKPPKLGEPSFEQFENERRKITAGFQKSATIVEMSMENLQGLKCNPLEGGIFFYLRIYLKRNAIEKANDMGLCPDEYYALELLKATGICVLPGSKLGQKQGTYHVRMTLTSDTNKVQDVMSRFRHFHLNFMRTHSE